ncbi:helix-turn-helix domain-containing protein [Vibrio sp. PP-XX7]
MSQKVLSQKLKQLERDGLISRHPFPTVPVTVEYRLTPLGESFSHTMEFVASWVEKISNKSKSLNIITIRTMQKSHPFN